MNQNYYYGSILITLIALIASVWILPGKNEVALMQLEDGNLQAAFAKYQSQANKGDFSLDVAMPLSRLYLQYGDIDNAIHVMERFVALHPDSAATLKQLGELYKSAGRMEDYLSMLKRQGKLAPSQAVFREMLTVSDFLCRDAEKQEALQQLILSPGYTPEEQDYITLSYLYANQKRPIEAIETLKTLLTRKSYAVNPDTLALLLALLIENGYTETAFNIASIYTEKHSKSAEAAHIMALFRTKGKPALALHFAKPFLENAAENPAFLEEYLTCLLATGNEQEARTQLVEQLKQKQMPGSLPEMLFDLALKYKDSALLLTMAATIPLNTIPEETLMQAVEMALSTNDKPLARTIYTNIGEKALAATPVLRGALEVAANPTPEALATLASLSSLPLTPTEQLALLRLYAREKQYLPMFSLAETLPLSQMLSTIEPIDIAEMYLLAGSSHTGIRTYLAAQAQHNTADIARKTTLVLLFLAAASGDEALFTAQEERLGTPDSDTLADSYTLAEKYNQPALSLILAHRLYAKNNNTANQMQLADALLKNQHYSEALPLLGTMVEAGKPVESAYLDAVAGILKSHQGGLPSSQKHTFFLAADRLLMRKETALAEKKNIGYMLLNAGYRKKAITLFLALADQAGAESDTVKELLFLAGDSPSEPIRSWLEKRAADSHDAEQPLWLHTLLTMHQQKTVISLVEAQHASLDNPEIADIYLEALRQTKAKDKLAATLKTELAKGSSPTRCRKLAMLAVEEGLEALAEQQLSHLLTITPDDTTLLEQLGLYYFYQGHYSKAEHYLNRYLKLAESTAEIDYAYADIFYDKQDFPKAMFYYRRAASLIAALTTKDVTTRSREAHILYRLGKVKEAAAIYRLLLKEQPGNDAIKADFANMLIENRQFSEADTVLGGGDN